MIELARARQEQSAARNELDELRSRLTEVESENQVYSAQYHQIEHHSGNLSNLYVASYQLHASVERQAVLTTIQEIVINLIGSEEVAIFQRDEPSAEFRLAASFGVDESRTAAFTIGSGPIGWRLLSGQVFIDDCSGGADQLTACVPLKIEETIIGAIVVFRLLEHKQALEQVDHELFDLLSVHASTALYCSTLHEVSCLEKVQ